MSWIQLRPLNSFTGRLLLLYFAAFLILLVVILSLTGGRFSYALDDPYIHLALAQNISHGHYGLNAGENTSPSSSVIWPLLLAPFGRSSVLVWVPLALNVLLSITACFLLGRFWEEHPLRSRAEVSSFWQWAFAALFLLSANLLGLTFIGMEHVLQIVLVIGVALGILEAFEERRISTVYLVMAACAPAVRYEDLAFTLGLALACFFQRRRIAALVTFGASLLPLVAFSIFLHLEGMKYLPNSVLVKGDMGEHRAGALQRVIELVRGHLQIYFSRPAAWPILFFAVAIGVCAWSSRREEARFRALLCAVVPILFMICVGPYGWFYRYEVCVRLFSFLILFAALATTPSFTVVRASALATVAAFVYLVALVKIAPAAEEISLEQAQMARFAHDYYKESFAVNDLGLVSFNKGDQYALDLWGLASAEAMAPQKAKNAAWLESITARHQIGLVMIFPGWFQSVPASWTPIAELHTKVQPRHLWHPKFDVTFYATPAGDAAKLRQEMEAFAPTLPAGSWVTMPPPPAR